MLTTSPDVNLALLSYRATPLPWCGLSPAELLMGRVTGQMFPRMSKHSHQSGHIYQCTGTRRRGTERFKSKSMITITGLGDYQNYQTTPLFGLVHLKDKSLETLFHLHQSQGHIMLKYCPIKSGETVHI